MMHCTAPLRIINYPNIDEHYCILEIHFCYRLFSIWNNNHLDTKLNLTKLKRSPDRKQTEINHKTRNYYRHYKYQMYNTVQCTWKKMLFTPHFAWNSFNKTTKL